MPKLDLVSAQQIKGTTGEILQLKAPGFAWSRPQQIEDFYGVGPGQIPMDHLYALAPQTGGNLTSVANSGGAGAAFNLSVTGTIPVTDDYVTLDPTDRFDLANRAEMVGTTLVAVIDMATVGSNQVIAGSNVAGDVTNVTLLAGGATLRIQRNTGSGFVNTDIALSPAVTAGLRIYRIGLPAAGGNATVHVNGVLRGTQSTPHTAFGIRRIAAGQGATSGLNGKLFRTLSLIHGGDFAARLAVIEQRLADRYGVAV